MDFPEKLKPAYIKKMIREHFSELIEKQGFAFYKPDMLLRFRGLLIHSIGFQRVSYGSAFRTAPSVQLLLAPSDTIHLLLGDLLSWEKDGQPLGDIFVEN